MEAVSKCFISKRFFKKNNLSSFKYFVGSQNNPDKNISLAWELLNTNEKKEKDPQFIIPLFKELKETRPYILNPKISAPTSLPLYFFFGYQLLQESPHMEKCGPVG